MANWKRLTDSDGVSVDVNLDNIAYIRRSPADEVTTLFFISITSATTYLTVKETPDQIHKAEA